MNNNPNSLVNLGREADFHPNTNRKPSIRSQKKFMQALKGLSHPRVLPTQIKAFVDAVPQNETLIEDYIHELKQKLVLVKLTSRKKLKHPLQQDQLLKRSNAKIHLKSKAKSIQKQNHAQAVSQSLAAAAFRRSVDYEKQGVSLKREGKSEHLGASLNQRRIATEKQSQRYLNHQEQQFTSERGREGWKDARIRSNTEEVIRATKHPARMYRYSSLKKAAANSHDIIEHNTLLHQKLEQDNPKPKATMGICQEATSHQKIGDISTIVQQKQSINFLGESCLGLQKELQPHDQNVEKLFDFFGWKAKELQDAFSACKPKKKKPLPDKLSRIFPKGFFV